MPGNGRQEDAVGAKNRKHRHAKRERIKAKQPFKAQEESPLAEEPDGSLGHRLKERFEEAGEFRNRKPQAEPAEIVGPEPQVEDAPVVGRAEQDRKNPPVRPPEEGRQRRTHLSIIGVQSVSMSRSPLRFLLLWCAAAAAVLGAASCGRNRVAALPEPHLDEVLPAYTVAGRSFNTQQGGEAAMAVRGTTFGAGARIRLDGRPLATAPEDGHTLTAVVPPELYATPGLYPVTVESPEGKLSNALPFVVFDKTGPPPEIRHVFPAKGIAGQLLNPQPNGMSAVSLTGAKFLPDAVVEIQGAAQKTMFVDVDRVTAEVESRLLARPGTWEIVVRNPDGKRSAAAALTLTAP